MALREHAAGSKELVEREAGKLDWFDRGGCGLGGLRH
jgi:hypothetical protein